MTTQTQDERWDGIEGMTRKKNQHLVWGLSRKHLQVDEDQGRHTTRHVHIQ
jgi:hypothetical protein